MTEIERAAATAKHVAKTSIYRLESVRDEIALAIDALKAVVDENGNAPRALDIARIHCDLLSGRATDIYEEVRKSHMAGFAARRGGK